MAQVNLQVVRELMKSAVAWTPLKYAEDTKSFSGRERQKRVGNLLPNLSDEHFVDLIFAVSVLADDASRRAVEPFKKRHPETDLAELEKYFDCAYPEKDAAIEARNNAAAPSEWDAAEAAIAEALKPNAKLLRMCSIIERIDLPAAEKEELEIAARFQQIPETLFGELEALRPIAYKLDDALHSNPIPDAEEFADMPKALGHIRQNITNATQFLRHVPPSATQVERANYALVLGATDQALALLSHVENGIANALKPPGPHAGDKIDPKNISYRNWYGNPPNWVR